MCLPELENCWRQHARQQEHNSDSITAKRSGQIGGVRRKCREEIEYLTLRLPTPAFLSDFRLVAVLGAARSY